MILGDYQYLICIPLLVGFAELRWIISSPTELIGCYFSLLTYVKHYDKHAGLRAAVDDAKEFETVAAMLDFLDRQDPALKAKIDSHMAEESNRKSMT